MIMHKKRINLSDRKIRVFICILLYLFSLLLTAGGMYTIGHTANVILIERFISLPNLFMLAVFFLGVFDCFIYWIMEHRAAIGTKELFYFSCMLFIGIFLLAGFLTHGEAMRTLLFSDKTDSFMDFFNSIQYGLAPYENKVIYPPLINLFYALWGKFVIIGEISEHATEIRSSQMGNLLLGLYLISSSVVFFLSLTKLKIGTKAEKILFLLIVLFSTPFLYAFERGNSIILAVAAMACFLCNYDAEKKSLRYLAFVCLGISAGIKIAPALFGLILLRERRFKDAITAAVIGTVIFMVPFVFLDGNIFTLLENIQHTTALFQGVHINELGTMQLIGNGVYVNLSNTGVFLSRLLNFNLVKLTFCLNILLLVAGIFVVSFGRAVEKWKIVAILSSILILCPGFSAIYNLAYILLPLVLFLNINPERNKLNVCYAILFAGMIIPLVNFKISLFQVFISDIYPLRLSTVLESLSVLLFVILLEIESIYTIYNVEVKVWKKRYRLCLASVTAVLLVSLYGVVFGFKAGAVEAFYPSNLQAGDAVRGVVLQEGQYSDMEQQVLLRLKSKKLLEDGLLISLGGQSEEDSEYGKPENVEVYVNGQAMIHCEVNSQQHSYAYIAPEKLADILQQDDVAEVRIERDGLQTLALNYVGPAKALKKVAGKEYIDYASSGAFRFFKDAQLWMGRESHFLIDGESVADGMIIKYHVPQELFSLNEGKSLSLDVFVNDRIVKTILLNNIESNTVVLQPDELGMLENNDFMHGALNVTLKVNATYSGADFGDLDEKKERSIAIDYLGPCKKETMFEATWLSNRTKRFYINTGELKEKGLNILYYVPSGFLNQEFDQPMELEVSFNGEVVRTKQIPAQSGELLDGVVFPAEMFDGDNHVLEVQLKLRNSRTKKEFFTDDDEYRRSILLKYFGKGILSESFWADNQIQTNYTSHALNFNKNRNGWYMGNRAVVFLSKSVANEDGVHIGFEVEPYLFEANKDKHLQFTVYMNNKAIKDIPIVQNGSMDVFISKAEMGAINLDDQDLAKFELRVNGIYNLEKMKILAKESDNRSVLLKYIGVEDSE